eukprot:COSAG01_NODE_5135_length_4461_cov_2.300779_3_plen_137_part_00
MLGGWRAGPTAPAGAFDIFIVVVIRSCGGGAAGGQAPADGTAVHALVQAPAQALGAALADQNVRPHRGLALEQLSGTARRLQPLAPLAEEAGAAVAVAPRVIPITERQREGELDPDLGLSNRDRRNLCLRVRLARA